jgi:hypothetical protein
MKVVGTGGGYTAKVVRPDRVPPRSAGALVFALALARPALGAEPCQITLEGPNSAAFRAAADELNAALRAERLSSPCTRLVLHAGEGHALLTFSARDGRSTERRIDEPIELIPTVQALSVLVPASEVDLAQGGEPEPESTPEPKPPPEPEPPARSAPKPARRSPPAVRTQDGAGAIDAQHQNPYALSPLIGVQAGFRGGANRLITPLLTGSIALLIEPWELGLVGRFEPHYVVTTGGNEDRPDTWGLVLGPTFGIRKNVGPYALRAGGMLLLAALFEDNGSKDGRAEGRVGLYVGGVFPRASSTRFRVDLGVDLVPYNIGRSERNAAGEWSLPWWAATFALGLEFG